MSDNFTYVSPNPGKYLQALLKFIKSKGENSLYDLLKNSRCEIDASSTYSRSRWNAIYTTIYFYVPTDNYNWLNTDDEKKSILIKYCNLIMPKNVGFDVMNIEISPSIETEFTDENSFEDDLEEFSRSFGETEIFSIPDDVLVKGKEMMKVYLYLYASYLTL